MNIAMVILNTLSVQYDARVRKEIQALSDGGHIVRLVGIRQQGETLERLGAGELQLFSLWTRSRLRGRYAWPIKYAEYFCRALYRLLGQRTDAYHAHDLDALPVALVAGWLRRVPVVYDAHELFGERVIEMAAFWRWLDRRLLNRATLVIAANGERAEVMEREYGASRRPMVLMNTPSRRIAKAPARLREVLSLPADCPLVVYQGALAPGRGLEGILASIRSWPEDAVCVLVGSANAYASELVRQQLAAPGMIGRVYLAPAVKSDEVADYISEASVGLVLYENTCRNNFLCAPNKLFEYCLAGIPVVASKCPPVDNVLAKFPIGLSVDPDDPAELASAISRLLRDSSLAGVARRACADAIEANNWETEQLKLIAAYRDIEVQGAVASGVEQ